MKLVKAQVTNFRSVSDSEVFQIDDLTCLVGKNEAGKSAVLDALYGINPYRPFKFEKVRDYPRRHLAKFDQLHLSGTSKAVTSWWKLNKDDIAAVESEFGEGVLRSSEIQLTSKIGDTGNTWAFDFDDEKAVKTMISRLAIPEVDLNRITDAASTSDLLIKIKGIADPSEPLKQLSTQIGKLRENRAKLAAIDILHKRMPKFFKASHFDRMAGEISLDALETAEAAGNVSPGDQIFLDFIKYAGTSIEQLKNTNRHEELKGICEAASNDITEEIFQFWSQNDALSVQIDLAEGRSQDPAPFNSGTIVKIRIHNGHHKVSVPLSERSAGFVWFFSFLAQFKQLSANIGDVIVLLDEPGLTLHGKAQSDLLEYIEHRLLEKHQVIYTTHSPFMVPAQRLANVRVVEDVLQQPPAGNRGRPEVLGTKVSSEILSVDNDTLFPLLGHLGYEITQSLFVGANTLLVEGPSDILYIQAASRALKAMGGVPLTPKWTICPTGGIDKVQSFASLFAGNKLNVAALTDFAKGDKNKLERLKQSQILKTNQVFTTNDFTGLEESDVEDFFDPALFIDIVNKAYSLSSSDKMTAAKLAEHQNLPRIVKRIEAAFRLLSQEVPDFDHFTPADYLLRNPDILDGNTAKIKNTLERFETLFKQLNALLDE